MRWEVRGAWVKRLGVGVLLGALPPLLFAIATGHSLVAEGILWNGDGHCMKGRDGVGHTPYLDARTISLKDAYHSGIECGDYDAVGQDELKISPNLGKLRKNGYKKCRDYGTFTNASDDVEVLRFVANPEDPPCGKGIYRNITWHGRYFNGDWKTGYKASHGHRWRRNYVQAPKADGVLTPASEWWLATPEQAQAAEQDNAYLIEVLLRGGRNVYVLKRCVVRSSKQSLIS
jgi:hypothetical protein